MVKSVLLGASLAVAPSLLAAQSAPPATPQLNSLNGLPSTKNHPMPTRKLGKLEVSELGAGYMSISANYGPAADKTQSIRVIRMVE